MFVLYFVNIIPSIAINIIISINRVEITVIIELFIIAPIDKKEISVNAIYTKKEKEKNIAF